MTVIRTNYKVPLSPIGEYFSPLYDLSNPKYWICLDMYKDDSIPDSNFPNGRPCLILMVGGGVDGRIPATASAVTRFTSRGWIVAYVLYHHPRNTDPLATPMPPWSHYSTPGTFNYSLYNMNLREVYNLHMGFKYIVDNLMGVYQIDSRAGKGFFLSGKSMGGAAVLEYSFLSMLNTFEPAKYGSKICAIFNACGIKGQGSSGGWRDPDRALHVLCRAVTLSRHPMLHTYNDGDATGDYDIYQRLRYAVPADKARDQYFVNFTNLAHDTENTFVESAIDSFLAGTVDGKVLNAFYMQGSVKTAISVKSEMQEIIDSGRDKFKNLIPSRRIPAFKNFTPISSRGMIEYVVDYTEGTPTVFPYPFDVNKVKFSKRPNDMMQLASLTKMMNLLVAYKIGLFPVANTARFECTADDDREGSGANINVGEAMRGIDAPFNMMLISSNVTANMVARLGGKKLFDDAGITGYTPASCVARFVEEMNKVSLEYGMTATFTSPSGLGNNRGTPIDAIKLVMRMATTPSGPAGSLSATTRSVVIYTNMTSTTNRTVTIQTTNKLAGVEPDMRGGKTGTLTPLYNFAGYFQRIDGVAPNQKISVTFIAALEAATDTDRFTDTQNLYNRIK